MRRILALAMGLLLLLGSTVWAESLEAVENSLQGFTLEELYALREQVDARIAQLENPEHLSIYPSGTYRVGVEIPEGVYLLKSKELALLPSVLVRTQDDSLDGESVEYEMVYSTAVMRFASGSFVTLTDVDAYPFDQAEHVALDGAGEIGEGGYWVGEQIPAGTYRVALAEKVVQASYSVYDDVPGSGAQLLKFEVITQSQEVELSAGQYISLVDCSLKLL